MVDRTARNHVLASIDAYLHGHIRSHDFDRRLQDDVPKTRDRTVLLATTPLWTLYDDFIDHSVNLSKPQWDFVQRLRLVLMSNAELESRRRWTPRQPLALLGLLSIAIAAWRTGFDRNFWLIDMTIGAVTVASLYLPRVSPGKYRDEARLAPFSSVREILTLRRQVSEFHKHRYPSRPAPEPLRGPIWSTIMTATSIAAFTVLAPLPLLLCLLGSPVESQVHIPAASVQ